MMSKIHPLPTVGFLGTGTIASALVTGFCERAPELPFPIVLSPRNNENAAKLRQSYPERVSVAETMQEVVDRSDWVILSLLPQVGEEVCRALSFRREQGVINLLSDKTLPQVRSWIGETAWLVHMVPLTFNAFCNGPIILTPPCEEVSELFGHIGTVLPLAERFQAAVLASITGCVMPMYAVMEALIQWAVSENVPRELAARYITGFFEAVCKEAVGLSPDDIHTMSTVSTPGGLNVTAKKCIEEAGGFEAWKQAMAPLLDRLTEHIPR